ncbi:hypothetical protein CXB51_035289 [Gossypium anomalum]|uniref:Protein kinase domain-containing protein n=1 Tax=Gossypium anomalum TaxID=47600 RepID=A0A8J6CH18_9ROSI|nr:hypothetical protein CXB51_035289 [Gossypium anomalum]
MANDLGLAFYITIGSIAFIISKIILTVLLYKRWKRKNMIYEDGFSGGKMVMFRSPLLQSLTSDVFLKKTLKLSNKDIIGAGGYGLFDDRLNYDVGKARESKILDWPTRYKIALGAARGVAYLHHDCIPQIIHRDIKSSNILLDQNMEPRVSDFGLATLMEPDETCFNICCRNLRIFGPSSSVEYFDTGRATAKGDVYSFGVVLLELLTGKKPTDEAFLEEGTKLVTWVKGVVEERREEYVVDNILGSCPVDEVNKTFNIALMCLETDPSKRPTMAEVVKMLEQIKSEKL